MSKKRNPAPYIKDLNTHRIQRLDRWIGRVFLVPFVSILLMFLSLFTILGVEQPFISNMATLLFALTLLTTLLSMAVLAIFYVLRTFEHALQTTEAIVDKATENDKKKKKRS